MKRNYLTLLITSGVLFIIIGFVIIILTAPPKLDKTGYKTIDNLKVAVYSKIKVKDLLKKIDGKLETNPKINTEELGKQEITFIYRNKEDKKRQGIVEIEVVDEEEPLVWLSGSYSVQVGSKIDLEKEILCADNYDDKPTCKIKGKYDLNKEGTYNLTYIAKDSSNNEERVNFNLYVYNPKPVIKEETDNEEVEEAKEVSGTNFKDVVATYKEKETEIGIDVSKWQGDINFKKVKKAGAQFVMIRVGAQKGIGGEYVLDPYFKKNIEKALKNNLKVGIYFYSYADSEKEAKKQAEWTLKQIKDYKISLPIAFDWECYNNFNEMELSLFGLNKVAESYLATVEEEGYDGMLYGSKTYLNSIWKYHDYDVWLAHYTDKTDYNSHYVMWQLCQDGIIDGINGAVDINILYKKEGN